VCSLPAVSLLWSLPNMTDMERGIDKHIHDLQEHRSNLEAMQNQQAEDSRSMAKQQKSTERYLAKKNLLVNKKDECNGNIRDLGVLPEEAFEKYINEKSDRVSQVVIDALSR
jgi:structural maintenance of chromosome 3 (chondroitin sulfate proteoglycan 6)